MSHRRLALWFTEVSVCCNLLKNPKCLIPSVQQWLYSLAGLYDTSLRGDMFTAQFLFGACQLCVCVWLYKGSVEIKSGSKELKSVFLTNFF